MLQTAPPCCQDILAQTLGLSLAITVRKAGERNPQRHWPGAEGLSLETPLSLSPHPGSGGSTFAVAVPLCGRV